VKSLRVQRRLDRGASHRALRMPQRVLHQVMVTFGREIRAQLTNFMLKAKNLERRVLVQRPPNTGFALAARASAVRAMHFLGVGRALRC
jgi:antitoxin component of MazEF toxin-antitoxin module